VLRIFGHRGKKVMRGWRKPYNELVIGTHHKESFGKAIEGKEMKTHTTYKYAEYDIKIDLKYMECENVGWFFHGSE
jgi:hypothetical protein